MKSFFLLIFTGIFTLQLSAQGDGIISGRLFDNASREPLPFATVTVTRSERMVTGTVTNENGRFVLEGIDEGEYIINCSFVGYNLKEIPLLVGKLNNIFDLGRIFLEVATENIEEVIVSAKREIISSGLDKKSFDIDNNISQSGGSVFDAMRNLPGVSIDQEGKLLLRGSDKVSVLLDGKQSSLTGFGTKKVLKIFRLQILNTSKSSTTHRQNTTLKEWPGLSISSIKKKKKPVLTAN
jgi:hypothetical protein